MEDEKEDREDQNGGQPDTTNHQGHADQDYDFNLSDYDGDQSPLNHDIINE